MRYFASNTPSEPWLAPVSVKRSSLSVPLSFEYQQHRLRMPRVPLGRARRRVIARDRQDVRLLLQQNRQRRVEIFNRLLLRLKVAVLAVFVGVLEVNEEEIEIGRIRPGTARTVPAMVWGPSIFFMPTSCARPLYIGYTARAAGFSL